MRRQQHDRREVVGERRGGQHGRGELRQKMSAFLPQHRQQQVNEKTSVEGQEQLGLQPVVRSI